MDTTRRFDDRAAVYARSRPGYPGAAFDFLSNELGLTPGSVVADIGAGTGILAEHFLRRGNAVWCVEPNRDMWQHAERLLAPFAQCRCTQGTAEATELPAGYFDFVVAGQAFHWFKVEEARSELARILKRAGWVVLLWNQRESSPDDAFLADYEALLQEFNIDYALIKNQSNEQRAAAFFGAEHIQQRFPNPVHWDFEHIAGYMFSASYMPLRGTPQSEAVLSELRQVFDRYQHEGKVSFNFTTELFCGRLRQ